MRGPGFEAQFESQAVKHSEDRFNTGAALSVLQFDQESAADAQQSGGGVQGESGKSPASPDSIAEIGEVSDIRLTIQH